MSAMAPLSGEYGERTNESLRRQTRAMDGPGGASCAGWPVAPHYRRGSLGRRVRPGDGQAPAPCPAGSWPMDRALAPATAVYNAAVSPGVLVEEWAMRGRGRAASDAILDGILVEPWQQREVGPSTPIADVALAGVGNQYGGDLQMPNNAGAAAPPNRDGRFQALPPARGPAPGAPAKVPGIITAIAERHTSRPPRVEAPVASAPKLVASSDSAALAHEIARLGAAPVETGFTPAPLPPIIKALKFRSASDVRASALGSRPGSFTDRGARVLRQQSRSWPSSVHRGDCGGTEEFGGSEVHARPQSSDSRFDIPFAQAYDPSLRLQATAFFPASPAEREGAHATPNVRGQISGVQWADPARPLIKDLYETLEVPAVAGPTGPVFAPVQSRGNVVRRSLSVQNDRPSWVAAAGPVDYCGPWTGQGAGAAHQKSTESFGRSQTFTTRIPLPGQGQIQGEMAGAWVPLAQPDGRLPPPQGGAMSPPDGGREPEHVVLRECRIASDGNAIRLSYEKAELLQGMQRGHQRSGRSQTPHGQAGPRPQRLVPGAVLPQHQVWPLPVGSQHAPGPAVQQGKARVDKQAVTHPSVKDSSRQGRGSQHSPVRGLVHNSPGGCGNAAKESTSTHHSRPAADVHSKKDLMPGLHARQHADPAAAGNPKHRVRFADPEVATEAEGVKGGNHRENRSPRPRFDPPSDELLKSSNGSTRQSTESLQVKRGALANKGVSPARTRATRPVASLRKPLPSNLAGRR